ncbi:MAG TPA: UvrD-helicase domain-containing protein [Burkholderiales bacterium]
MTYSNIYVTKSAKPAPDAAERERAFDITRSFVVQAPAGSGKTELLIQRIVRLLATVEHPEEVVAITFTRKAAAEMRERVLKAVAKDPAIDRWDLAQNPARLRIQTIDSLAASLTRQMPVLSRFGASPEPVEDASELHRVAARATLDKVEAEGAVADAVARLLEHLDNDLGRIEGLLAAMLAKRDHWIRHLGRMERGTLEAALAAECAKVHARCEALYGEPMDDWAAYAASLLTKANTWRANLKGAYDAREDLRLALVEARDLPPAQYSDRQWEALAAIAALLPYAIAELRLAFEAAGQVDFTEVSQAALEALGTEDAPTDLMLALDYRIRHLLVDEFQDTSISQYQLIERLTAGWEPGDGRTVFAVGDPMQSIYRWREAEVGEFLRVWKSRRLGGVALETVQLRANFRSQSKIVDWVNAAFPQVMPETEDAAAGRVPYAASAPVHPPLAGEAVQVHAFAEGEAAAEAARVVEVVHSTRAADATGSIAVLVRARTALAEIVPAFKVAGIRFRAIEIDALGERPVVQDLFSLTRALTHLADRTAWLAVLRAPWCGLTLAELCAFFEVRREDTWGETVWEAMAEVDHPRLARVREVLGEALDARLRTSLRDAVESCWLALGGPACVESDTDLEDAGVYLDALEAAEVAGDIPDATLFEAQVARLYALPDVHAGADAVQIMTIHKSKGLEFDHVIVPGLGRAGRGEGSDLFLWMESPESLLVAPIGATGADEDPLYQWVKQIEAARSANEWARLLYVAATRAKSRLHLLGGVGKKGEPSKRSLLSVLWPAVAGAFGEVEAGETVVADPGLPDQRLVRLPADWVLPEAPAAVAWAGAEEARGAEVGIEFSWVGETARHVGTVVHRWLQRVAEDALEGWTVERVAGLRAAFRAELASRGVLEVDLDAAVERVATALANALRDERGQWILGSHPQAWTEQRITAVVDGVLRRLVVDRMFVTDSGARWLVDYKTSHHAGGNIDAFLARERERYQPQMERYAKAVGGTPDWGLYFPLLSRWIGGA